MGLEPSNPMEGVLDEQMVQRKLFGRWLRTRRLALGKSVAELAEAAMLSPETWQKIEAGTTGVRRERIPGIAAALDADADEMLRQAGFAAEAEGTEPVRRTRASDSGAKAKISGDGHVNMQHLLNAFLSYIQTLNAIDARLLRVEAKLDELLLAQRDEAA